MKNPTRLPALMIAVGLAFSIHYGSEWRSYVPMTEAQVQEQVEFRLAAALAARGEAMRPRGEKMFLLIEQIETEVRAKDEIARREIGRWLAIGLFVLVIGTGQFVFVFLAERMKPGQ